MTRKSFFAAIAGFLGVAEAQQHPLTDSTGSNQSQQIFDTAVYSPPQWKFPLERWANPKNNQCPVCGTMADAYKPDTRFCGDYLGGQPATGMGLMGCEPMASITRCKRCNAAFWQDAVVEGK